MTVTLTSPVLGLDAGDPYTGPEEAWLLAEGYARQDGYTGPGVSNTGLSDTTPANDLTLAANREPEPSRDEFGRVDPGRLDPAMDFNAPDAQRPAYDFDANSVNTEAPSSTFTVTPDELPLAGAIEVTLEGQNFEGTTGVTFGGTAGTGLVVVDDSTIRVTAPAKTAGTYDVAVTNPNGTGTKTGAVTYA